MKYGSKLFTISNLITVSRIILLPFIVYFLITGQRYTAFVIMLVSLCSDAADGFLARKLHQESEAGKVLDPVCDKISLTVIVITLLLLGAIPVWGVIIIVLRDILILVGSFFLMTHKSKVFKSNIMGKLTGGILGAVVLAFTINLQLVGEILLYLSIPAIVASFGIYLSRYIKVMKGEG
ncbi:MAG: CDP-alcohol phosphatidyltransferase family protein [bacterium]